MTLVKKILVTKEFSTNDEFDKILRKEGFDLLYFPTIKIKGIIDFKLLDEKLSRLNEYDGIFFTSANAVKYFFARANTLKLKYKGRIYSVGEKTKAKVESYDYESYAVPEYYSAEGLLKSLPIEEIKSKSFLFPRGNLSMEKLREGLSKYAKLDEVIVYNNIMPEDINKEETVKLNGLMNSNQIACIVFFSPSAIANFFKLFPVFRQGEMKIAAIGDTTKSKAAEFGLKVDIVADKSVSESLASAIVNYFNHEVKYAC